MRTVIAVQDWVRYKDPRLRQEAGGRRQVLERLYQHFLILLKGTS